MVYQVSLTARAQRDLILIFDYIQASESATALRWYRGLKRAILTLQHHPYRCAMTPEYKKLRHLLYGRRPNVYRVIYRIVESRKRVEVLHIRHGARQKFII